MIHHAIHNAYPVARGMFDQERMRALLKLTDQQSVRLTQSIGPKK